MQDLEVGHNLPLQACMPFFIFYFAASVSSFFKKEKENAGRISNILSIFCIFLIENKEAKVVEEIGRAHV